MKRKTRILSLLLAVLMAASLLPFTVLAEDEPAGPGEAVTEPQEGPSAEPSDAEPEETPEAPAEEPGQQPPEDPEQPTANDDPAAQTAKPVITAQPTAQFAASGHNAVFSVTAEGEELTYQWYYRKKGSSTWNRIKGKTENTLTVEVKSSKNGYWYRCLVQNSAGKVKSASAKLTVVTKPKITAQPKAISPVPGEAASFRVKASGGALQYQWYYQAPGSEEWEALEGQTAAACTFTAEAGQVDSLFRCRVYNDAGETYSNAALLKENRVAYRALLVGEVHFPGDTARRNKGDVLMMQDLLKTIQTPQGDPYSVTCKYDLSNAGMKKAINSAFAGADGNDVSLFFIATHGVTSVSSGSMAGALVTLDAKGKTTYLELGTLAEWLAAVPGEVIVFIGSCGSGAAISDNGLAKSAYNDDDAFCRAVVAAFSARDGGGRTAKIAEFCRPNKFYVMTAAKHMESSWGIEGETVSDSFNLFTYYLAKGGKGAADDNSDGSVTLDELFRYVDGKSPFHIGSGTYSQHARVYPENSGYVLFKHS